MSPKFGPKVPKFSPRRALSETEKLGIGYPRDGKIRLFHGTTTKYLAEIQEKGLVPRAITKNSNWNQERTVKTCFGYERSLESLADRIYLTDLWHYYFAFNAAMMSDQEWWKTWTVAPIFLEVEVREENLGPDEDYVHNGRLVLTRIHQAAEKLGVKKGVDDTIRIAVDMRYPDTRIDVGFKSGTERVKVTWKDSMEEYGCVAHIGRISPSQIKSITVLGDMRLYLELMGEAHFSKEEMEIFRKNFNLSSLPYYANWSKLPLEGKRVVLGDIWKAETKYPMVSTFYMKDFVGKKIAAFRPRPDGKCMQAILVPNDEK